MGPRSQVRPLTTRRCSSKAKLGEADSGQVSVPAPRLSLMGVGPRSAWLAPALLRASSSSPRNPSGSPKPRGARTQRRGASLQGGGCREGPASKAAQKVGAGVRRSAARDRCAHSVCPLVCRASNLAQELLSWRPRRFGRARPDRLGPKTEHNLLKRQRKRGRSGAPQPQERWDRLMTSAHATSSNCGAWRMRPSTPWAMRGRAPTVWWRLRDLWLLLGLKPPEDRSTS